MKRVRVYKEIISDENLRLAIQEVNAGHRRNGNHSLNKKVIEIENNMDEYVEKLRATTGETGTESSRLRGLRG